MMKKHCVLSLLSVLLWISPAVSQQDNALPEWQHQYIDNTGQIPAHASVIPHETKETALKGNDPLSISLNGKWKFSWTKNTNYRPKEFYYTDVDLSGWDDITVPGNWERQGYGIQTYLKKGPDFTPYTPPTVPEKTNEVGSYRRSFYIPEAWEGRRVVLSMEGVSSFFYVWLNGELLGCSQNGKTESEWDITDKIFFKEQNILAVEVYKWNSGSYLDCGDSWRLSGIDRNVKLYSTPLQYITDYETTSTLEEGNYSTGEFSLTVHTANCHNLSLRYSLYDKNGEMVITDKAAIQNNTVSFAPVQIKQVKPWSAEKPNLYRLLLELIDSDGTTLEYTASYVGFRKIAIKEGELLINGRPVKIKGVIRHEHSQEGKNVTKQQMISEIQLMKQY